MARPTKRQDAAAVYRGADDKLREAIERIELAREKAGDGEADLLIQMIALPRAFIAHLTKGA